MKAFICDNCKRLIDKRKSLYIHEKEVCVVWGDSDDGDQTDLCYNCLNAIQTAVNTAAKEARNASPTNTFTGG